MTGWGGVGWGGVGGSTVPIVSKLKEKKLLGSSEKFELNVETILRRPSMNCGLKSDLWGNFCRR